MAGFDETALAVAAVYARSLFELADEHNVIDVVADEFDDLAATLEAQRDFAVFMASRAVDDNQRARVLEKLFRGKLSDLLLNTLLVMNAKGRSALTAEAHARFRALLDERRQRTEATVTTARPLDDAQRGRIADILRQHTGLEVAVTERVDADVLGGLVVEIGDELIDGSVARRLGRLRSALLEHSRQEMVTLRQAAIEA